MRFVPFPSRRQRRLAGWTLGIVLLAAIAWPLWLHLTGNFHTVVPDEVYRAAQPSPADLQRWTAEHGIKSVLNLRGAHEDADWYRQEAATARALGLVLADFPLSARENPRPERMADLVDLMRRLPKPLLIHCQGGADRTGLAAALYLASIAHSGEQVAEHQLSFAYGHVGLPVLSSAWAMNEAWEDVEPRLGYPGS
ncbi:MAG: dual specificity protein phosphatase family protein [Amaricoccus sp.]|uniref:dual specificity protein phosphatase family protein n=1 Tax=Amaricoccus sp. TaxID=1872485 RepID=UPI0039E6DB1E